MAEPLTHTVAEAAQALGIGKTHLYRLVLSGEIPSIQLGKRRLITPAAVRRFLGLPPEEPRRSDEHPEQEAHAAMPWGRQGVPLLADLAPGQIEETYVVTTRRVSRRA